MATTSTFQVEGMTCGHCVNSVQSEVSDIDGVTLQVTDARQKLDAVSAINRALHDDMRYDATATTGTEQPASTPSRSHALPARISIGSRTVSYS